MGKVELYHPVDEDKAREFVEATAPAEVSDEDKDERVAALVESARVNAAWRDSRGPEEQVRLGSQPFASAPDKDDPEASGEGDE